MKESQPILAGHARFREPESGVRALLTAADRPVVIVDGNAAQGGRLVVDRFPAAGGVSARVTLQLSATGSGRRTSSRDWPSQI